MLPRTFARLASLVLGVAALALPGCPGGATKTSTQPPSTSPPPATGAGGGGGGASPQALYTRNCSACHGPDAHGLPNLGRDLVASQFVDTATEAQFVEFVNRGRPADDPLNTTGVPMPPKGGNPALSDADIRTIFGYLRAL